MNEEESKQIKKELYRYKILYEITLEENKLLKENYINMQNTINEIQQQSQNDTPKRSLVYRGLRKIYHIVKR